MVQSQHCKHTASSVCKEYRRVSPDDIQLCSPQNCKHTVLDSQLRLSFLFEPWGWWGRTLRTKPIVCTANPPTLSQPQASQGARSPRILENSTDLYGCPFWISTTPQLHSFWALRRYPHIRIVVFTFNASRTLEAEAERSLGIQPARST